VQIGNSFLDSILYTPARPLLNRPTASLAEALPVAEFAEKGNLITAKYDLHNISPREIDLMARELKLHDMIADSEVFKLLTFGADYLSNQPDQHYSEEMLDSKVDLVAQLERQIAAEKAAGNPVEAHKNVLEFLHELEVRSQMPVAGIIA
jgi:hypothetical protein